MGFTILYVSFASWGAHLGGGKVEGGGGGGRKNTGPDIGKWQMDVRS